MRKDPQLIHWIAELTLLLYVVGLSSPVEAEASPQSPREFEEMAREHFEQYCFDCHDGETKKGEVDVTLVSTRNAQHRTRTIQHRTHTPDSSVQALDRTAQHDTASTR